MSGESVAFFLLSLSIFTGAILMISLKKVVHMVFALAFTFLSIAGIYILLNAEFVAVVQVLVYTGAISMLMVFGIMMTPHHENAEDLKRPAHKVFVFLTIVVFLGFFIWGIQSTPWGDQIAQFDPENTKEIGVQVFTNYVIPFELVSVLLLVALVGAIIMAKEEEDQK